MIMNEKELQIVEEVFQLTTKVSEVQEENNRLMSKVLNAVSQFQKKHCTLIANAATTKEQVLSFRKNVLMPAVVLGSNANRFRCSLYINIDLLQNEAFNPCAHEDYFFTKSALKEITKQVEAGKADNEKLNEILVALGNLDTCL